jgi:deoxyribose-phosphate aldolase
LDETLFATNACITAGVDFIKTSTGKVEIGAELDKIQVMSQQIREKGASLQIKASGGIRTLAQIESFQLYVHRYGIGYKTVDALLEGNFNCKSQEY